MSGVRLNRRLTLEAPMRVADGAGGFVETWTPLGVVWAEITSRSGRETAQGNAPVSSVAYRITVRATPLGHPERPSPDQRFCDGARVFNIKAVSEADADGRYLSCHADEEVVT